MKLYASAPFVLGMLANVAGGYLSDFLVRRFGLKVGRRLVGVASLSASALLLLGAAASADRRLAVVFLALSFGVMDLMLPATWALCVDVGRPYAGAVTGAMNMAGQAGGFCCTIFFGMVVGKTQNYHLPLFAIATMLLVSALLFSLIDPTRPIVAASGIGGPDALLVNSTSPASPT